MLTHIDPHAKQPLRTAGPSPETAAATVIMIHGRGASADSILSLHAALGLPTLAAVAPQAADGTWYPHSFLAPLADNQPHLESALRRIESVVSDLIGRGVPAGRIALLGFSQGACLTSEFVARHPRRYGAAMALTGGLIGPAGTTRDYKGDLAGTPVFLGSGDPDPHVPFERVRETEAVLKRMGATIDIRRYPGRPHTISQDELDSCRTLLADLTSS